MNELFYEHFVCQISKQVSNPFVVDLSSLQPTMDDSQLLPLINLLGFGIVMAVTLYSYLTVEGKSVD